MGTRQTVDVIFNDLLDRLHSQCVDPQTGEQKLRWTNLLTSCRQSDATRNLVYDYCQRNGAVDVSEIPGSLVNFILHLAQYEQQATGEKGIPKIIYPNDLWENISTSCLSDPAFRITLNNYFALRGNSQSDPDMVRVFQYVALDTAMQIIETLPANSGRTRPYNPSDPKDTDRYFQAAQENIVEIAACLQTELTWADIFEYQKAQDWKTFEFFLSQEGPYKMTYPDRYTLFLKYLFNRFKTEGVIPEGTNRIWLVGAGDAPELQPLVEILGIDKIENVYVSDIHDPGVPFPMVKSLVDGEVQCPPDRMIMDPRSYLEEHGWHSYIPELDITHKETIPDYIRRIGISTMLGVLVHIDGPENESKKAYKRALTNWFERGKKGALFIALWISKDYFRISAMVAQKVGSDKTDIDAIREHRLLGRLFNIKLDNGSLLWSKREIKDLGIKIIFPSDSDIDSLQPGVSWIRPFIDDRTRRQVKTV